MRIRPEQPADAPAVRALLLEAFPGPGEADLVERLRQDGDAAVALVAAERARVFGQVMLSPMRAPFRALGLGPLAVAPTRRRTGVGTALVRDSILRAKADGWQGVFVLGAPDYYERFGFSVAAATGYRCRYTGPHFMLLSLAEEPLPARGEVAYARAFAGLD
jgi:putative acetyltransferase